MMCDGIYEDLKVSKNDASKIFKKKKEAHNG